jgi:hypothetical protein
MHADSAGSKTKVQTNKMSKRGQSGNVDAKKNAKKKQQAER